MLECLLKVLIPETCSLAVSRIFSWPSGFIGRPHSNDGRRKCSNPAWQWFVFRTALEQQNSIDLSGLYDACQELRRRRAANDAWSIQQNHLLWRASDQSTNRLNQRQSEPCRIQTAKWFQIRSDPAPVAPFTQADGARNSKRR
jgi:hypothetical protein